MNKKTGIVRSDYVQTSNVEIYHVNLKRVLQKYYNKEEMTTYEKALMLLIIEDEKELKEENIIRGKELIAASCKAKGINLSDINNKRSINYYSEEIDN